jgi:hypothetical protein
MMIPLLCCASASLDRCVVVYGGGRRLAALAMMYCWSPLGRKDTCAFWTHIINIIIVKKDRMVIAFE